MLWDFVLLFELVTIFVVVWDMFKSMCHLNSVHLGYMFHVFVHLQISHVIVDVLMFVHVESVLMR